MLKGKSNIGYTLLKLALYTIGYWEYLSFGRYRYRTTFVILISILVVNSFFRQFYLFDKEKLRPFGKVSVILEFLLGIYIASYLPVGPSVVLLTPTIFESIVAYTVLFGGSISIAAVIGLVLIDMLNQYVIVYYTIFFRNVLTSYLIGFIMIFIISCLASLQFRERERISKVNKELEQAYKQLLDNASKLQELSVEKERTRLAREIHDTLAHTLTAVVVQMEASKKLIDIDSERAKSEIEKAQELTRSGLSDVKRTIKALRPQVLENSSLTGAIYNLIENIEDSAKVKVIFFEDLPNFVQLSPSAEVALFRVIQESITNAIRHGLANQIEISMKQEQNMINIVISDNGKGCAHIKEGYGLKGITERIKGLGGVVHFASSPGNGFNTQISIPYEGGISNAY